MKKRKLSGESLVQLGYPNLKLIGMVSTAQCRVNGKISDLSGPTLNGDVLACPKYTLLDVHVH